MQRNDTSWAVLACAVGLLLVVLGLGVAPPAAGGSAADPQLGGVELVVAQVTLDDAVARPSYPVQPTAGGFFAVLPASRWVVRALSQHLERESFCAESCATDVCMRLMRAPPAFVA